MSEASEISSLNKNTGTKTVQTDVICIKPKKIKGDNGDLCHKMYDAKTSEELLFIAIDSNVSKEVTNPMTTDVSIKAEDRSVQENISKALETDPYSYTKLKDFTSEIYKLELGNLPTHVGYRQLKKLLNTTLNLNTHKVKSVGKHKPFVFITFRNEEDKNHALNVLNGYTYKGRILTAKKASPMADPLVKKRKAGVSEDCPNSKVAKCDDEPIELKLKNAVTPLWNVPYEKQLEEKQADVAKFLVQFGRQIEKTNTSVKPLLDAFRKQNNNQCCPLDPIKPSPLTAAYRNKCEFTAGLHLYTKQKTVGFRLNRYKEGSMSVAEPDDCINISKVMLKAVKSFEEFIRESEYDVYNPENHEGYWKQLTVRTSNNDDVLIIIVMHPLSLSEDELEIVKKDITLYYETGKGAGSGVTSVYFQLSRKQRYGEDATSDLTHLSGKKHLEETLMGMKFQISPESFFQVNVSAAEVLYSTVADFVGASESSSVLDLCCGTGTISLCLAKAGAKVVGVEICQEAVANARVNAANNDVANVEFMCGKAEDVIISSIIKLGSNDTVAVVNPPRAGMHQKVLKVIRANKQLKKLVYVSCSPKSALTNFLDLCRPMSNNFQGVPFYPVRAAAIDMFPHTPHKELVLVFERSDAIEPIPI